MLIIDITLAILHAHISSKYDHKVNKIFGHGPKIQIVKHYKRFKLCASWKIVVETLYTVRQNLSTTYFFAFKKISYSQKKEHRSCTNFDYIYHKQTINLNTLYQFLSQQNVFRSLFRYSSQTMYLNFSLGNLCHSSTIAIFLPMTSQTCSIGFMSDDIEGQSIVPRASCTLYLVTILALYGLALLSIYKVLSVKIKD